MAFAAERFDSRWLCAQPEAWLVTDEGTEMSFAVFPMGADKNLAIIASGMMTKPVFLHRAFGGQPPRTMGEMPKWFGDSTEFTDGTTLAFCWLWCYDQEALMNAATRSEWSPGRFEVDVRAWREALISKDGMTDTKHQLLSLETELAKLKQSGDIRAAEGDDPYYMNRLTSGQQMGNPRIAEVEGKIRQLRACGDGSGTKSARKA